jgi:ferric-dicitrate binding protein FerR (iron transport regulator)
VSTDSVLSVILGHTSGFSYKDGKVNVARTFLLASIASKAGKELSIQQQLISKSQKSILNHLSWREGWIVSSDGTYTGTFATFQAVVSLGFLNNIL